MAENMREAKRVVYFSDGAFYVFIIYVCTLHLWSQALNIKLRNVWWRSRKHLNLTILIPLPHILCERRAQ